MNQYAQLIDQLDISIFNAIPSQTNDGDRRSLLAIQRAVARKYEKYCYLEIGSHLGGTLQPHCVDERCLKIYSVDPRPLQQPDDSAPGAVVHYADNSSQRMLDLLSQIEGGNISKIECMETTTAEIDSSEILQKPHMAFIDGEHTNRAAKQDWDLCHKVLHHKGLIAFHDFHVIYPTIWRISKTLQRQRISFAGVKLEGGIYAIFFDPQLVDEDEYLRKYSTINSNYLQKYVIKQSIKQFLPDAFWKWLWNYRIKLGMK